MKKVLFFAGREHHYLKLKYLARALSERAHVRWVIANNSINIDPPEEFLVPDGVEYDHLYEYLPNRQRVFDIDDIKEAKDLIRFFPAGWLYHALNEAIEVHDAFDSYIKIKNPDALVVLHTNNFWTKQMAYAMRRAKKPVFAFQEGLLRERDQEALGKQKSAAEYCTRLFVWSNAAKESYIKAGVGKKRIVVSGPLHLAEWMNKREESRRVVRDYYGLPHNAPVVLYALPLLSEYKGSLSDDIARLQRFCRQYGAKLLLRPHPFDQLPRGQYSLAIHQPIEQLLQAADVVIVQHTTVGIEALKLGTPIIELDMANAGIEQSWAELGLARKIASAQELLFLLAPLDGLDGNHIISTINDMMADPDIKRVVSTIC